MRAEVTGSATSGGGLDGRSQGVWIMCVAAGGPCQGRGSRTREIVSGITAAEKLGVLSSLVGKVSVTGICCWWRYWLDVGCGVMLVLEGGEVGGLVEEVD